MYRYYMNAETRDAVIAESKRMIAAARAHRAAPRPDGAPIADTAWSHAMPAELEEDALAETDEAGSAFASLVSDLWSASASTRRMPMWGSKLSR